MFDESAIAYKLGSHQRDKKAPTNEKANKGFSQGVVTSTSDDVGYHPGESKPLHYI